MPRFMVSRKRGNIQRGNLALKQKNTNELFLVFIHGEYQQEFMLI